jgi:hypothetical protein
MIKAVISVWKVVVSEMVLGMGIEGRVGLFGKNGCSLSGADVSYV